MRYRLGEWEGNKKIRFTKQYIDYRRKCPHPYFSNIHIQQIRVNVKKNRNRLIVLRLMKLNDIETKTNWSSNGFFHGMLKI